MKGVITENEKKNVITVFVLIETLKIDGICVLLLELCKLVMTVNPYPAAAAYPTSYITSCTEKHGFLSSVPCLDLIKWTLGPHCIQVKLL